MARLAAFVHKSKGWLWLVKDATAETSATEMEMSTFSILAPGINYLLVNYWPQPCQKHVWSFRILLKKTQQQTKKLRAMKTLLIIVTSKRTIYLTTVSICLVFWDQAVNVGKLSSYKQMKEYDLTHTWFYKLVDKKKQCCFFDNVSFQTRLNNNGSVLCFGYTSWWEKGTKLSWHRIPKENQQKSEENN